MFLLAEMGLVLSVSTFGTDRVSAVSFHTDGSPGMESMNRDARRLINERKEEET